MAAALGVLLTLGALLALLASSVLVVTVTKPELLAVGNAASAVVAVTSELATVTAALLALTALAALAAIPPRYEVASATKPAALVLRNT